MTDHTLNAEQQRQFRFLTNFAIIDVVVWLIALTGILILCLLPWLEMRSDGTTYSALQLLLGEIPETRLAVPELIGVPWVTLLGLFAFMSLQLIGAIPRQLDSQIQLIVTLVGFATLAYYPLVVMRVGLSITDTLNGTGLGFDLMFWISVFLIFQSLITRKFRREHLIRPTNPDGTRGGYGQLFGRVLNDDMFGRNVAWFIMCLPALIWLFLFKYLTMYGLLIAFQDYKPRRGIEGSEFLGLENFAFLFQTDVALRATRNTLMLNLLFIVVGTLAALLVATLLFEVYDAFITRFYQTALLLPNFISWVIVSYFVFAMLGTDSGIVNTFLVRLGINPINWYSSPEYWPVILLLSHLWHAVGFSSLIYLAGMLGIDPMLYDAAKVDGATKWQQFRRITLPLLVPLVIINVLLALGNIFSADFGLFFQVTRDTAALYETTDVLDTFIYRSLIGSAAGVRLAAAAQIYQSVVGFVLVIGANWLVRRLSPPDEDLSLF